MKKKTEIHRESVGKEQNNHMLCPEKMNSQNKKVIYKINQLSDEDFQKVIEAVDMLELMKHQSIPKEKDLNKIMLILDLFSQRGRVYAAVCVFHYGVMQGKRNERRKRRER